MIIGIAGPTASGKTTIAHMLEKHHGAVRMRYSSILSEMARERGLDADDKATLQNLYVSERETRGENFLTEELKHRVALLHPRHLVIEGNRRLVDVATLRELAAERNEPLLLIFVDASSTTRFTRYNDRLAKQGDHSITEADFATLEQNPAEDEVEQLRDIFKVEGLYLDTDALSEDDVLRAVEAKLVE